MPILLADFPTCWQAAFADRHTLFHDFSLFSAIFGNWHALCKASGKPAMLGT
jgi:hypothetical protein